MADQTNLPNKRSIFTFIVDKFVEFDDKANRDPSASVNGAAAAKTAFQTDPAA